jgi:hypothetical protein
MKEKIREVRSRVAQAQTDGEQIGTIRRQERLYSVNIQEVAGSVQI